jgi:hypothetical protein
MTCTTCTEFFQSDKISKPFISGWSVPIDESTPANIIFDTRTDIIEYVQKTVLINDDDLDIIHNDFDIEIGHNVDTSVQCGPSHTFTSYKHRNSN